MKLAIISAVWQRPDVFKMFACGVNALIESTDVNITVIIAGSEGHTSRVAAESHGFTYIEVPNNPVANKFNAALQKAAEISPDYVLCLGSDDIISPSLFKTYKFYMRNGTDFIGLTDFYFYDQISKRAMYWAGYIRARRLGETCGAGRMLSKRLLDMCEWQLWNPLLNRALDNSMSEKLKLKKYSSVSMSLRNINEFALGIKSYTNITPFTLYPNSHYIDPGILLQQFPYLQ